MTGANPFALSYEKLKPYILTVRDYLIKCQAIAMFANIRDIKSKEVWQLKKLRAMGLNGLSIGTESGDNNTLFLANKDYTSQDILEQCQKLDEAGEKERLIELQAFIKNLQIRTYLFANCGLLISFSLINENIIDFPVPAASINIVILFVNVKSIINDL